MAKPVIAVDIDEVLFPLAPTLLEFHNSEYDTSFALDDMTSYFLQNLTGVSEEVMLERIGDYLETEHFTQGMPVENAVQAIQRLRERFRLVLITARQPMYRGKTEPFIEEHFAGLFDTLRYTHTPEEPDITVPKHLICRELGAEVLIDDSLHNVLEAAKTGIDAVLFGNYAWNVAEELPKSVTRCADWPAVLEYFDGRG